MYISSTFPLATFWTASNLQVWTRNRCKRIHFVIENQGSGSRKLSLYLRISVLSLSFPPYQHFYNYNLRSRNIKKLSEKKKKQNKKNDIK
jgi:hypothetical protein